MITNDDSVILVHIANPTVTKDDVLSAVKTAQQFKALAPDQERLRAFEKVHCVIAGARYEQESVKAVALRLGLSLVITNTNQYSVFFAQEELATRERLAELAGFRDVDA